MGVNFYLAKRQRKDGDVTLRVSISVCGYRQSTSFALCVTPQNWNTQAQEMKKGTFNASGVSASVINARLAQIKAHFAEFETRELLGVEVTEQAVIFEVAKIFHKGERCNKAQKDFFSLWWEYIDEQAKVKQWSQNSYRHNESGLRVAQKYAPKMKFADMTKKGLQKYFEWLTETEGLQNNSAKRRINNLKSFLLWAVEQGYYMGSEFRNYSPRCKTIKNNVIYLTWEELQRLFNYQTPKEGEEVTLTDRKGKRQKQIITKQTEIALKVVQNMFLFSCFTSLRYSDLVKVKKNDIQGGKLFVTIQKTGASVTIELNKYALAVLERNKDYKDAKGFAMPIYSNGGTNRILKKLCELCEINEMINITQIRGGKKVTITKPKYKCIGTHTARRTFIVNALSMGITPNIVMKWTGHRNYNSLLPYIDITDEAKENAMKLFDKK